jgi:hypothetical protein
MPVINKISPFGRNDRGSDFKTNKLIEDLEGAQA